MLVPTKYIKEFCPGPFLFEELKFLHFLSDQKYCVYKEHWCLQRSKRFSCIAYITIFL